MDCTQYMDTKGIAFRLRSRFVLVLSGDLVNVLPCPPKFHLPSIEVGGANAVRRVHDDNPAAIVSFVFQILSVHQNQPLMFSWHFPKAML